MPTSPLASWWRTNYPRPLLESLPRRGQTRRLESKDSPAFHSNLTRKVSRFLASSLARAAAVVLSGAMVATCVSSARRDLALLAPPGYTFPYATTLNCPSEVCVIGRWLACDSVPLHSGPAHSQPTLDWIQPGERFDVVAAAAVTFVPGAVEVTETVRQRRSGGTEREYVVGDTVFILAHLGEGWFSTVHRRERTLTEIFWPWDRGSGWKISGRVVQENEEEVWLQAVLADKRTRWLRAGSGLVVSPFGQVEPLRCSANGSATPRGVSSGESNSR